MALHKASKNLHGCLSACWNKCPQLKFEAREGWFCKKQGIANIKICGVSMSAENVHVELFQNFI
jgi:hypothetical protein